MIVTKMPNWASIPGKSHLFLRGLSLNAVSELDRAEKMLALGRYIPGFDHLIPPNVPWRKWKQFMEQLKKLTGA